MNLFTRSMLFYYFGKYLQMKNHKKTWKKFQIKTSKNDFCCNLFDFNILSLQTYQIQGTAWFFRESFFFDFFYHRESNWKKGRVTIKDATEPSFEPNTCGKAEKPVLRGWRLKLMMRLSNTKFGEIFLEPILLGPQNLEFTQFWKQKCNFTPTFCPVKIPLPRLAFFSRRWVVFKIRLSEN